jgi:hypothetical protein
MESTAWREQREDMSGTCVARPGVAIARAVAIGASLLIAACATQIERQAMPFTSPVIEVAPGAPYRRCVTLESGDRLYFSYRADPPISFAITRPSSTATVSFVVREASRDESGVFLVPESAVYCLQWTPATVDVPWPTLLRFDLRVAAANG